ncbi:hypothetical protein [Neisseria sp. Ec49-e6-T10]|uniref:hypothetical protein n=1 Tax=Neisseria sp. Ec49-e6-T10 TaxID=3140744 RepID=UPI003EB7BA71
MRVNAYGKNGVVTGTNGAHLLIRIDGEKGSDPYHPTSGIIYYDDNGNVLMDFVAA